MKFRADVVASYPPDADLLGMFAAMPRGSDGLPEMDSKAVDWVIEESVMIPPLRQTLRVTYDIEASDQDEAETHALDIFDAESRRASLPTPETVIVNFGDRPPSG